MENEVIKVIRLLLKGAKNTEEGVVNALVCGEGNNKSYLWNCDYLLNQAVRQYNVPQERYFYSVAAKELWESLGFNIKDLKDFYYREMLEPKKENVRCLLYSGSHNKPYKDEVGSGDKFPFKDAFHLEHMIPVSTIIEKLKALPNDCSDKDIEDVLNLVCVARITKEEDRKMHNKNARGDTFESVYNDLYKENGVYLLNNVTNEEVK